VDSIANLDYGPAMDATDDAPRRRRFLASFSSLGLGSTLFPGALRGKIQPEGASTLLAAAALTATLPG
jgi:hypothetical protein